MRDQTVLFFYGFRLSSLIRLNLNTFDRDDLRPCSVGGYCTTSPQPIARVEHINLQKIWFRSSALRYVHRLTRIVFSLSGAGIPSFRYLEPLAMVTNGCRQP